MLLELHVIQNFPPSCLNRDDLNAPKDCEFGGVRRARISSQSLKRAARHCADFKGRLTLEIGTRTKLLRKALVDALVKEGRSPDEALRVVEPVVASIGSGVDEKDGRTSIALYLGHDEITRIGAAIQGRYGELLAAGGEAAPVGAEAPAKGKPARKPKPGSGTAGAKSIADEIFKSFKPGSRAADIALFGRMIAKPTNFNVDAAAQVAHAISTHAVPSEFDFFTAVDDLQPKGDPAAGMMGTQQFNSATFYRYANVHMNQLGRNLAGDAALAREAALAFAHSFITAIPAAKQNSHAALTRPDLVLAVVRSHGQPLSLANAFVKPVPKNSPLGLVGASGRALASYWERTARAYGSSGVAAVGFYSVPEELDSLTFGDGSRLAGLDELLSLLRGAVGNWSPEVGR